MDGGRVATCCDRDGAARLDGAGRARGLRPVNTERAEARGHGGGLRLARAPLHPLAKDGRVRSGGVSTREGRAWRGRRVGADGMKRNLKAEGRFFQLKPRGGDLTT